MQDCRDELINKANPFFCLWMPQIHFITHEQKPVVSRVYNKLTSMKLE